MQPISIKITNLPKIRRAFMRAPQLTTTALNKAIRWSIFTIMRDSKLNTPVDTDRLRASHTTMFSTLQGTLQTNTNYDVYVHEGTRYMKDNPYMLDAVIEHENDVQEAFVKAIQDVLDRIARQT